MSYEGNVNAAELHFESFMDTQLAYNLCSSDGQVADGQMARWPGDRWPGSQVTGFRWYEKMINKINRAEKTQRPKISEYDPRGQQEENSAVLAESNDMLGDKKQKTKELFSFSKRTIIWTKYVCNCPFCSSSYFVGLHVCKFVNLPSDKSAVFIIQVQSTIR